ncbi:MULTISPECIES: CpaF family protein [Sphingomonas]|uniref:CpaF family protein n=1 Tax=Sphingomonas zeae TaxID=1646122 RepID=A0A7Y6B9M4_9SPHN|nr:MULTISPECIES: CpaF family protein [Sphingomonas]MBB4046917.1 pilus assembly protein CpaF [Sphingomonas zeae]MDK8184690.1 CpaF family protein [Sphingomonas zeae]MDK8214221.1 CpaF family protein [Sphingomonas sp. UMB7805-LC452B]NUU49022.1 CpaF family protein [Sphingomonas zeae]
MSAFGRRQGLGSAGGGRPAFGVARPMHGPGPITRPDSDSPAPGGGSQFPPLNALEGAIAAPGTAADAMQRLAERQAASVDPTPARGEGFEASIHRIKEQVLPRLLERVDPEAAATLGKDELAEEFRPIIGEVLAELKLTLNRREQFALEKVLVDELLGLGPLEELLADTDITDIMVNGPEQTYVERKGKLELANIRFRDEEHLFQVAQRIVNSVGRRVDQTTPLADARLKDGSRVNVIVPPLSLRGTAISIRKFSAKPITLDMMANGGSMSQDMATLLKIAGASRFNIVISGGTGSGKTTMLNALSKMIDPGERVLTIEDAAELRLQQPHWLPLETRPANLEGQGEISIRDLVKNALRMRPDRIILGEIRGSECFDLLAAMNTGHDGSMCTLHSNSPREALARMENMVMMSDIKVPKEAISRQIADSVDMVVQVKRLRDGSRRVTNITEVIGMEGPVIVTQELFAFEYLDEGTDGKIIGEYRSAGLRPYTLDKAKQFGFDKALLEACL